MCYIENRMSLATPLQSKNCRCQWPDAPRTCLALALWIFLNCGADSSDRSREWIRESARNNQWTRDVPQTDGCIIPPDSPERKDAQPRLTSKVLKAHEAKMRWQEKATQQQRCPSGHPLCICLIDVGGTCDVCGKRLEIGKDVMECRKCNW